METAIQDLTPLLPAAPASPPAQVIKAVQPRAQGTARLRAKRRGARTVIGRLHQQGSLKLLFPQGSDRDLTAVTLNTAGGITGGDRFDLRLVAEPETRLTLTTQAAERAYRAAQGAGRVCTGIRVERGARLSWLPQETILYDRAALSRSLDVTLEAEARCLLVESLVFGRAAMGETVTDLRLDDRITLRRAGRVVFADRTRISGDAQRHLARGATGQGASAMASLVFTAPDAADLIERARSLLPETAGISAVAPDILFARLLAPDSFALRQSLIPLIDLFHQAPLPRPWMI